MRACVYTGRLQYGDSEHEACRTRRCTNGTIADTVIVYAKTQPDQGAKGITAFIVEKGMPVRLHCSALSHAGA